MQFLVTFQVKNETSNQNEISHIRKELQNQIKKVRASHKLKAGGVFADARGGFLVLDVANALELNSLLAPAIIDLCAVKSNPIMSFQEIDALFTKLNASTQQHMHAMHQMKQKITNALAKNPQRVHIELKQQPLQHPQKHMSNHAPKPQNTQNNATVKTNQPPRNNPSSKPQNQQINKR